MYQYIKSKFKWNPVTIRIVWVILLVFSFVFWYYSFKLFDFIIKSVAAFIFI